MRGNVMDVQVSVNSKLISNQWKNLQSVRYLNLPVKFLTHIQVLLLGVTPDI